MPFECTASHVNLQQVHTTCACPFLLLLVSCIGAADCVQRSALGLRPCMLCVAAGTAERKQLAAIRSCSRICCAVQLVEVVMDLGRPPLARFPGGDAVLREAPMSRAELEAVLAQVRLGSYLPYQPL